MPPQQAPPAAGVLMTPYASEIAADAASKSEDGVSRGAMRHAGYDGLPRLDFSSTAVFTPPLEIADREVSGG